MLRNVLSLARAEPFVIREEEDTIAANRSAECESILILPERWTRSVEEVTRVQFAISEEFVDAPMERIRAGSDSNIDNSDASSVLGRKGIAFDFELLYCIHRGL